MDDSDWLGGHGSFPFPETSIATWRLSEGVG